LIFVNIIRDFFVFKPKLRLSSKGGQVCVNLPALLNLILLLFNWGG
jgi:hypothetical protein